MAASFGGASPLLDPHLAGHLVGRARCASCGVRGAALCRTCRGRLRPPLERLPPAPLRSVVAAWSYDGPARALVLALKLRGERAAAAELAGPMREAWLRAGLRGTVVTWVPGRRPDIRRRGFDHAELLAGELATLVGLRPQVLLERKASPPDQSGLSATERARNLDGVFAGRPTREAVVLVDDLITTGATARACARALLEAGAAGVELIAACSAD